MRKIVILLFLATLSLSAVAQSLQHPIIWAKEGDRAAILAKIERNEWAQNLVEDLKDYVGRGLDQHQTDPTAIIKQIPAIQANSKVFNDAEALPGANAHCEIFKQASFSGMLYYVTHDEKYAQYAADILAYYIDALADRSIKNTTICGSAFMDPRTTYSQFAIAYDFIYNYLQEPGRKVYNSAKGEYVAYDNSRAQRVIQNMAGDVLQEYGKPDVYGSMISNHPILTAPGGLFTILCVEDDAERERLFNIFWDKGTRHQSSFTRTIMPMFGEQGIWPEALSYSFMPNVSLLLNIIDCIKPELKVFDKYSSIIEGNFIFDNLRFPNRRFVRYGDSHRDIDFTENLYRIALQISKRHNLKEYEQKSVVALSQYYNARNGYNPTIKGSTYDYYTPFMDLMWNDNLPKVDGSIDFQKPTVIVKHAGVALARNYVEKDNEDYGLCGFIGGAFYVHSQATGIAMELYGAGYIMAASGGLPEQLKNRKSLVHQNYYVRHAGNNTVIVNGTSHGSNERDWRRDGYFWQDRAENIAAEPKHLEDPINPNFNFVTQYLGDKVNKCNQERTLAIVRTSKTSGYYVDIFRSDSYDENKFHDYIYHNVGDRTHLEDIYGKPLAQSATDRYQNDISDYVKSPGWAYFEPAKATEATDEAVSIRFDIDFDDRYMHMMIPAGVDREYATTLAPPTREAKNGYKKKMTQVVGIRKYGEAWNKPFIVVFEPTIGKEKSVKLVRQIVSGDKVVGVDVVSNVDGEPMRDIIISQDSDDATFEDSKLGVKFTGRYGVVRLTGKGRKQSVELYIGSGKNLSYKKHTLEANADGVATKKF